MGAVLATFGDWHENRCARGRLTRAPRSRPAMRLLVVTAFTLRLLRAGAPIDPRGPPALPGSRQKAVLRRQVSDEPSGAPSKVAIFAMGRFWCAEHRSAATIDYAAFLHHDDAVGIDDC